MSRRNVLIIALLLVSAVLYALLRQSDTLFHLLMTRLSVPLPGGIPVYRDSPVFLQVMSFNLPEMLWIIALMLSLFPIDFRSRFLNAYKGLIVVSLLALLELSQYWCITRGTFDINDILISLLAVLLSHMIERSLRRSQVQRASVCVGLNSTSMRALCVYATLFFAHQMG